MKHNTLQAIKGKRNKLLEVITMADTESINQICQKAGITLATYYKYIKEPEFMKHVNYAIDLACKSRKSKVIQALFRKAESGNVQAIRTVLEYDGSLHQANSQSVNIYQETAQATTQTYKDSQEAIEDIDKRIEELQAIRQGQVNRLEGHAIHPSTETGTDE